MIALAGLLVLVAVALLVGGLSGGDTVLLWSSVAVSGLAAVVLAVQTVRRNRAQAATAAEPTAAAEKAPAAEPVAVAVAEPVAVAERVVVAEPVVAEEPAAEKPVTRRAAVPTRSSDGDPPEEQPEVTDLLLVIDLTDEVVVVDEHPRYHLAGCSETAGAEEIGLPLVEARQDGFTACGVCCPDQHVAAAERSRRAAAKSP